MFSSGHRKNCAGEAGPKGVAAAREKILAVRSEHSESPVALPAAPARLAKPGYAADPATGEPDGNRNGMDAAAGTATPGLSLCPQGPGSAG